MILEPDRRRAIVSYRTCIRAAFTLAICVRVTAGDRQDGLLETSGSVNVAAAWAVTSHYVAICGARLDLGGR